MDWIGRRLHRYKKKKLTLFQNNIKTKLCETKLHYFNNVPIDVNNLHKFCATFYILINMRYFISKEYLQPRLTYKINKNIDNSSSNTTNNRTYVLKVDSIAWYSIYVRAL